MICFNICTKTIFLINSMLTYMWPTVDHRRCSNVVKISVTHLATRLAPRMPLFCYYL